MSTVHKVAVGGFGAGTNDLYDRVRPSYPSQALTALHASLPESSGLKVVELGSGTGIFTRALLADSSFGQSIAELRAMEPSAGMRGTFEKAIKDSRVTCREGTFEKIGASDEWADLVVVAQAWHWCPDYEKGMTEIARVLKPSGIAAFIWNLEDRVAAPWVAQLRDAYEKFEDDTPQFRLGLWREMFKTATYLSHFHSHEEKVWEYILPTTTEIAIDRALSKSYVAILEGEKKEKVKADLEQILQTGEGKKWIDKEAGTFEYPYRTYLVLVQKK